MDKTWYVMKPSEPSSNLMGFTRPGSNHFAFMEIRFHVYEGKETLFGQFVNPQLTSSITWRRHLLTALPLPVTCPGRQE